jgi:hypothetical protein
MVEVGKLDEKGVLAGEIKVIVSIAPVSGNAVKSQVWFAPAAPGLIPVAATALDEMMVPKPGMPPRLRVGCAAIPAAMKNEERKGKANFIKFDLIDSISN